MNIKTVTWILIIMCLLLFPHALTANQSTTNSMDKNNKTSGLIHGQLSKCPESPNCINTEFPDDKSHYLPPLLLSDPMKNNITASVRQTVIKMGGAVSSENTIDDIPYLAATFTSSLFSFVDDFEVRIDLTAGKLHIRSASRTGYSDFGVNKRRVKKFIEKLKEREQQ